VVSSTRQPARIPPNTRSDQYRKRALTRRLERFGRELLDSFLRIDAMGLSKQVSFSAVFALVPTLFVLVAVASLVETLFDIPVTQELREYIVEYVPEEAQQLLLSVVDNAIAETSAQTASISGLIALGFALWAGMGGVATLVEATNRAYGVRNTRPWYRKRLIYLAMTVALTAMIVFSVMLQFFGERTIEELARVLGNPAWLRDIGDLGQLVIQILTMFIILLLLYRYAPSVLHTWRWSLPGAIFSTAVWLALLRISGFIAQNIDYGNLFGAATGFILLLYLLNFAGLVLIVGAVLNGVLGQRYDRLRREDLLSHPEKIRYVDTGQEVNPDPFSLPFKIPRP
jgi:membrane protein